MREIAVEPRFSNCKSWTTKANPRILIGKRPGSVRRDSRLIWVPRFPTEIYGLAQVSIAADR